MTQQQRIHIDLPNTAVRPKINANAWCHVVYTIVPGKTGHMMPCSPRTLDQSRSGNSDRDITKMDTDYCMDARKTALPPDLKTSLSVWSL